MVAAAHPLSEQDIGAHASARVPLDYIHSGETFSPDPPYLLPDDNGYADVYRLRDNKTIGPESVTLTTLTFIPTREEGRYDGSR